MILQAVPRRVAALALLVMVLFGQPGSVCAIHCLFEGHDAHAPHDGLMRAAAGAPAGEAPADGPVCHGDVSQLSGPAVQVAPLGPMAVAERTRIAAAPAPSIDGAPATFAAPDDVPPSPNRPPPRA